MSYTWREIVFDRAITRAIEGGFDDADFKGWDQLGETERLLMVRTILKHNGVGSIIFRKSFALAVWGEKPMFLCWINHTENSHSIEWQESPKGANFILMTLPKSDYHLQQMVLADDWLKYLSIHVK